MIKQGVEIGLQSLALLAASSLVLCLKSVRQRATAFVKHLFASSYISTDTVTQLSRVNEIIVGLRANTGADRVCVYQFHNGAVYSLANPVWKVSSTHETVARGTAFESDLKDVSVSKMTDLIGPVCSKTEPQIPGVSFVYRESDTDKADRVCLFDIDNMPSSLFQHIARANGVTHMLAVGLKKNGDHFGLLSLHFSDVVELSEINLDDLILVANDVEFVLSRRA